MAVGILSTDPGFARGQTLGVSDPSQGKSITGTVKVFTDADPRSTQAGKFLSNRPVTCIAVRNTSGGVLAAGTAVKFKAAAILDEVDGPAATGAALLGVVDEYLPSSGCAANDICWVVVAGPTAITSTATLAAGAAVTSTAGKGTAGDAAAKPAEVVGYAISATADGKVRTLMLPKIA